MAILSLNSGFRDDGDVEEVISVEKISFIASYIAIIIYSFICQKL